jgi:hypothetical protein
MPIGKRRDGWTSRRAIWARPNSRTSPNRCASIHSKWQIGANEADQAHVIQAGAAGRWNRCSHHNCRRRGLEFLRRPHAEPQRTAADSVCAGRCCAATFGRRAALRQPRRRSLATVPRRCSHQGVDHGGSAGSGNAGGVKLGLSVSTRSGGWFANGSSAQPPQSRRCGDRPRGRAGRLGIDGDLTHFVPNSGSRKRWVLVLWSKKIRYVEGSHHDRGNPCLCHPDLCHERPFPLRRRRSVANSQLCAHQDRVHQPSWRQQPIQRV